MTPTVGRIVHYVSYGTPGGEYKSECRAAVVTEVNGDTVGLAVLNPGGLFFHPLASGGCERHDGDPSATPGAPKTPSYNGGTWHWPERA
ncbi:hypothetical protein [Micromonospora sp. DT227]|uniref:hypothetical protein n=1 Tax=Micromonospora sp. DT227 TaxID=3393433 RepID=UPI003CF065F5